MTKKKIDHLSVYTAPATSDPAAEFINAAGPGQWLVYTLNPLTEERQHVALCWNKRTAHRVAKLLGTHGG